MNDFLESSPALGEFWNLIILGLKKKTVNISIISTPIYTWNVEWGLFLTSNSWIEWSSLMNALFFYLLYIFSVSSELRNSRITILFYKYKIQLYNAVTNNLWYLS